MNQETTIYVFRTKRPCDSQSWPLVYESHERATDAPYRVTPVYPVTVAEWSEPINIPEKKR